MFPKNKVILAFIFIVCFLVIAPAQKNHQIRIKAENYPGEILQLGYYFLNKTYLKPDAITKSDSLFRQSNGDFVFTSTDPIDPGMYLLVFKPDNKFSQILITEDDQDIEIAFDFNDITNTIEVSGGSHENQLFYDYLIFLDKKKQEYQALTKNASDPETTKNKAAINSEVADYQKTLIKQYPRSFTAAIIKSSLPIDVPQFKGSADEVDYKKWEFAKSHYFDNIELGDRRMLNTPFLYEKVENYINKLRVQHPDSLKIAVDFILQKMEPSKETFKTYLIHFLNKYAKSKIVGMDAVYVHIADNYYAKGKAPWVDTSQLQKILENANTLKPTLIGNIAPNILLEEPDGNSYRLHDIQSKYSVLFFWDDECGYCNESIEVLKKDFEKLKNLGVQLVAICTKEDRQGSGCQNGINNTNTQDWLHVKLGPDQQSARKLYGLKTTPLFFILDGSKKIVSKRIDAAQLLEMITLIEKN